MLLSNSLLPLERFVTPKIPLSFCPCNGSFSFVRSCCSDLPLEKTSSLHPLKCYFLIPSCPWNGFCSWSLDVVLPLLAFGSPGTTSPFSPLKCFYLPAPLDPVQLAPETILSDQSFLSLPSCPWNPLGSQPTSIDRSDSLPFSQPL